MKDLITAKELATRLGRDVSSVHRWLRRSKVKAAKNLVTPDSRGQPIAHFDKDEVERLIKNTFAEEGR